MIATSVKALGLRADNCLPCFFLNLLPLQSGGSCKCASFNPFSSNSVMMFNFTLNMQYFLPASASLPMSVKCLHQQKVLTVGLSFDC